MPVLHCAMLGSTMARRPRSLCPLERSSLRPRKPFSSFCRQWWYCCRPSTRPITISSPILSSRDRRSTDGAWWGTPRGARKTAEIAATPQSEDGGWLMLDKGYQDQDLYTEFRCADKCDVGVLTRAEKTPDGGWKGVYVAFTGEAGTYDLTLNADGKELSRTKLLRATTQFARIAAGPWANGSAHVPGFATLGTTVAEDQEQAAKPPRAASGRTRGGRWTRSRRRGRTWTRTRRAAQPGTQDRRLEHGGPDCRRGHGDVQAQRPRRRNTATNDRMMGYGPIALHVGGTVARSASRNFASKT